MSDSDQQETMDDLTDPLSPSPGDISYHGGKKRHFKWKAIIASVAGLMVLLFFICVLKWRAPSSFPSGITITVKEGMTITGASVFLKEKGVIRSPFWFKAWSVLLGGNQGLKAGEYYLEEPVSVVELAKRLTNGTQNVTPLRVTIPEGLSNKETAVLLSKSLSRFGKAQFLELAKKKEGYLFPDTYVFLPGVAEEEIIAEMEQNFAKRTAPLESEIKRFGKPIRDVLIMASLLEGEARTTETRRQISGILWKRLELNMPLQVDAVFPYILGKNTYEVTTDDLKVNSPYNTYTHTGLPPTPISNPGIDAITATVTPIATPYLYYLSDKNGEMHYAKTHAEHLVNRAKYLGK